MGSGETGSEARLGNTWNDRLGTLQINREIRTMFAIGFEISVYTDRWAYLGTQGMTLKITIRWRQVRSILQLGLMVFLGLLLVCGFHSLAIATSVPLRVNEQNPAIVQPTQSDSFNQGLPLSQESPRHQPRITARYVFYSIQGSSIDELNRQMIQNAPFHHSPGLSDFAAVTQWKLRWRFSYQARGNQCILVNPIVDADIKITLPTLQKSARQRLAVQKEWMRYIQALNLHEQGHKSNGIAAAQDIQYWMELLGPAPSCQILVKNVNTVAQKIVTQYRQKDQAYDRRTDHGLTQGAMLNRVNS